MSVSKCLNREKNRQHPIVTCLPCFSVVSVAIFSLLKMDLISIKCPVVKPKHQHQGLHASCSSKMDVPTKLYNILTFIMHKPQHCRYECDCRFCTAEHYILPQQRRLMGLLKRGPSSGQLIPRQHTKRPASSKEQASQPNLTTLFLHKGPPAVHLLSISLVYSYFQ